MKTTQIIGKNIVVLNAKISENQIMFDYISFFAMNYSSLYPCIGKYKNKKIIYKNINSFDLEIKCIEYGNQYISYKKRL